ncbi:MAG: Hsp20/alpha crystallin family protein [Chloroflexi bacterium]|nr:Hsp20/alpha crystallin family protein [Chloroflexota bacterium]
MTNLVCTDWENPRGPYRNLIRRRVVRPGASWLTPVIRERVLAVDMYETDDVIVVESAIPGIRADDLEISITGDTLTIKGETKIDEDINEENYAYRERHYGSFYRSLSIPVPVVTNKTEAEFENGVLTLTLPKAKEAKPKAIKVRGK